MYDESDRYEDLSTVISIAGVDFELEDISATLIPRMREAGFTAIIFDKRTKEVTCYDAERNFRQFYYE